MDFSGMGDSDEPDGTEEHDPVSLPSSPAPHKDPKRVFVRPPAGSIGGAGNPPPSSGTDQNKVATQAADEEKIREELKRQLDELLSHAQRLLERGPNVMNCRSTAIRIGRFIESSSSLELEDVDRARDKQLELRIKADRDEVLERTGYNVTTNGVDSFTRDDCEKFLRAFGNGISLETDYVRRELANFFAAVTDRNEELKRAETQQTQLAPASTPPPAPQQDPAGTASPSGHAQPSVTPQPAAQNSAGSGGVTTPQQPASQQATQSSAPVPGAPHGAPDPQELISTRPDNHVGQHQQVTSGQLRRRNRWRLAVIVLAAIVFICAVLAALQGGYWAWEEYLQDSSSDQPTSPEESTHRETVPEPEPMPEGEDLPEVEPPADPEPTPRMSGTTPARPTLDCMPFTQVDMCSASGSETTQAVIDECNALEGSPLYSHSERSSWWECANRQFDEDGDPVRCRPECCFCRWR